MRRFAVILTALLALAATAPLASAADLCISSLSNTFVAKKFRVPPRNQCKPINGFYPYGMLVGTGCTTSDGTLLRLHFTVHDADSDFALSFACNFVLPAMTTGNCRTSYIGETDHVGHIFDTATASVCVNSNVP